LQGLHVLAFDKRIAAAADCSSVRGRGGSLKTSSINVAGASYLNFELMVAINLKIHTLDID
jgi:hypothetical protein